MDAKYIVGIISASLAMLYNIYHFRLELKKENNRVNNKYFLTDSIWYFFSFMMGLVTIILYFTLNNEIYARSDIILGVSFVPWIIWCVWGVTVAADG
jgi:hypothetical protein